MLLDVRPRAYSALFADACSASIGVPTLVGQRVFGIALGYEDLNDHDQLRHDPVMATLVGKLAGPAARLCTAGGQEHAQPARAEPTRTNAISQGEA